MEDIQAEIDKILASKQNSKYDLQYGISLDGIHFAILTIKGLRYEVWVFGKHCSELFESQYSYVNFMYHTHENDGYDWTKNIYDRKYVICASTKHSTEEGAKNQIKKCKKELESGFYQSLFPKNITERISGVSKDIVFSGKILPNDVLIMPDKYLKAGEIIKTSSNNYGIYVGNGEIAFMTQKSKKEAPKPQISKLSQNFAENEVIAKLDFTYSFRKPKNIVKMVKEFANQQLEEAKYYLLQEKKNFIAYCAFGLRLPVEMIDIIYMEKEISPDEFPFLIISTRYSGEIFGRLSEKSVITTRKTGVPDVFRFLNPLNWPLILLRKIITTGVHDEHDRYTIRVQKHESEKEMMKWIKQCKAEIEGGLYNCMFPDQSSQEFRDNFFFTEKILPADAITNPDAHLQPGDILSTHFIAGSSHYGIYIGDGEVVHVSGHRDGKGASVARIGKLCSDFVNLNGKIKKLVFSYSLRTPEKIVEIAKGFADARFRGGAYNLLFQNCQHFVTRCALGLEICPDQATLGYAVKSFYRTKIRGHLF